jgi:hypothetical protein
MADFDDDDAAAARAPAKSDSNLRLVEIIFEKRLRWVP